MAITVNNTPEDYHPVYQPMRYSVQSDNTGQPNFRFIADIHVRAGDGTNYGKVQQLKFQPVPGEIYGKVNVAGVLKSFVERNKPTYGESGFIACSGSIIQYDVKFGEEYGPSSGITQYPNLSNVTNKYAWNGSPNFVDHIWRGGTFYSTDFPTKTLSTLRNSNFFPNYIQKELASNEEDWVYCLAGSYPSYYAIFDCYNSAGTLIDTFKVINKYTPFTTGTRMFRIGVGPRNIENLSSNDFLVQPANSPYLTNVASYTVRFVTTNAITSTSDTRYYKIVDKCYRDRVYDFIFLNQLGAYESFRFTGANQKTSDIQRNQYKKVLGSWDDTNGDWNDAYSDRGVASFATTIKNKFKVYSDWITEEESEWLLDLISSPDVLVKTSEDVFDNVQYFPVNILNTTYVTKREASDQLFNIEIEFEYSSPDYRQQW